MIGFDARARSKVAKVALSGLRATLKTLVVKAKRLIYEWSDTKTDKPKDRKKDKEMNRPID
jgi:hypothetical protein